MTTFGLDVSNYQAGLDLTHAAPQGYDFVIVKASEGTGYRDPHFATFHKAAREAGMLFAAYHFLHHGDIDGQVANLAAAIGRAKVPVMIDCEPTGSSRPTLTDAHSFRRLCKQRGIEVTLLYLPGWYHSQIGSPSLRGWRTVQSAYPSSRHAYGSELYPGDSGSGWNPYGGHGPFVWQFASSGHIDGYSGNVDLNAFKGTRAQLAREGAFRDYDGHPDHRRAKRERPGDPQPARQDAKVTTRPERADTKAAGSIHQLEDVKGERRQKRAKGLIEILREFRRRIHRKFPRTRRHR